MTTIFADRMENTRKSFIREILKVTQQPEIISFAGGLPNPGLFPVEGIAAASEKVLSEEGTNALQYSTTEGYLPLREFIAQRYLEKSGLKIDPDEILITNGSQQSLDLIGKVFLNKGDRVIIESPGYLGAIQAFSLFEPEFSNVPLLDDGIDTDLLDRTLSEGRAKLFYTVPTFQNPSGITYSMQKRMDTAAMLDRHNVICVEDNAYGELRFAGEDLPTIRNYSDNTILLGSFSKIIAPGLRMGWICAKKEVMEKLLIAKQAADLHSNYLSQRIIYQYLLDNDIDEHILKIKAAYGARRDLMVNMMAEHFPGEIGYTKPEGGMFVWVTLPDGISSMDLFELAIKENVAFVPGTPFYTEDGLGENTLRLNFSNSDFEQIEEGINRLAVCLNKLNVNKQIAE
ncbi:PLP-dependent aminotransferase family protein [Methanolobus mangrovi]|uniref:PLP-dependent aminotransferase family protein n=1 Tax=Methanolobus mangrovi TaxID=3072977 RepID=A0AA51YHI5_9EURY|nr:PLP-dependent aminotransferase family protein [Methanolobus mangrovi]WMW23192.1 PLP-dependent aminotransferase family protein [Methanolobus mangrovi]